MVSLQHRICGIKNCIFYLKGIFNATYTKRWRSLEKESYEN